MNRLARTTLMLRRMAVDCGPTPRRAVDLGALAEAVGWLCRAQDATTDGGVSAGYHLRDGWLASYPETTGYIAPTFFDLADRAAARASRAGFTASEAQVPTATNANAAGRLTADPAGAREKTAPGELDLPTPSELRARAQRMLDWLVTLQQANGGFPGGFEARHAEPIVFNTGQILFGLLRGLEAEPGRADWRGAAERAADWLVNVMDADGCWRTHTFAGVAHAYNARTAWALLQAGELFGDERLRAAAQRNLQWAKLQRNSGGWFAHCEFTPGRPAYTHTIAYCLRGIYEAGALLDDEELLGAVRIAAQRPAHVLLRTERLPGAFVPCWKPAARYRCLTGEAQLAIVWSKLGRLFGQELFLRAADLMLAQVSAAQVRSGPPEVRGALAGSRPIWGAYMRGCYPNWAAKFLVDALLELRIGARRATGPRVSMPAAQTMGATVSACG